MEPKKIDANSAASEMTTSYEWADLIQLPATLEALGEIANWMAHETTVRDEWGLKQRFKPGYFALFRGFIGTGKKMAACLLGKAADRRVFRIGLRSLRYDTVEYGRGVLGTLFDEAQRHEWILYLEEAEALFSKDDPVCAANPLAWYILDRIKEFDGVVIFASELTSVQTPTALSTEFLRSLHNVIDFSAPNSEMRKRIWEQYFQNQPYRLAPDGDLGRLAMDYPLMGSDIVNALRYACLESARRNSRQIEVRDLEFAIRRGRSRFQG